MRLAGGGESLGSSENALTPGICRAGARPYPTLREAWTQEQLAAGAWPSAR